MTMTSRKRVRCSLQHRECDRVSISDEIRTKFTAAKVGGGTIYHSDHSVSDNVGFASHQRVTALVASRGAYG